MATATSTKRPTKATSSKAPKVDETPVANEPATEAPEAPTSNGADLTATFWQALDSRNTKGDVSSDELDKVKAAYANTDPKRRANLVKALAIESGDRIVNDDGDVDQALARGRKQLTTILAEAREETSRNERPPHDPVPDLARMFAAVQRWHDAVLAELTADQHERLDHQLYEAKEDADSDAAKAADERVSKALATIRKGALNGRNGHSGPRSAAADVEAKVRKAVHDAHPTPLTSHQLAKAAGIAKATAYTRWETETPGVKNITGPKGERLFAKDTDPA